MSNMSITNFISRRFNSNETLPRSIRAMRVVAVTGITIGVAALVIATSIGRGFEKRYREALMDFNAHVVVMGMGEMRNARKVRTKLGSLDYAKDDPRLIAVTPFIYREALSLGAGKIKGVVVKGIDPVTVRDVNPMSIHLFDGVASLKEALPSGNGVISAVAGRALARDLNITNSPAKLKLLIPREGSKPKGAKQFIDVNIVGTFESGMHDYDAQFLLMSLNQVQQIFGTKGDVVTGLEIKISDPEKASVIAEKIGKLLGPGFSAVTWSELNRDLLTAVRLERLVSSIIMGIMVFVAALNIVAVLVLMAIHRFREVSVLKALGVNDNIIKGVLSRGGLKIGAIAIIGGIIVGVLVSAAIGIFDLVPLEAEIYLISSLPIDISPLICGIIALFCLGVVFLTSEFVSRRLSGVSVADGLRMAR